MRANREEDLAFEHERGPRPYTMLIAGGGVLVLAILLYLGLGDSGEAPPAPTPMPVVRDSAIVAPPVVDNPPTQAQATQNAGTTVSRDFGERQLAPPTATVGAGAAPVSERADVERLVIDGELLKELEEDAQAEGGTAN